MRISDWSSDVCASDLIVSKPTGPSVRHRVAGRAAAGVKSRRAITLQIPIVGSGHKTRQLPAGPQVPFRHPAGNPPAGPLSCVLTRNRLTSVWLGKRVSVLVGTGGCSMNEKNKK